MENAKPAVLRSLVWLGNSKERIRSFPEGPQKLLGDELQLIQFGGMPKDAKPLRGFAGGVLEIALRYASDAYRVVTAVQLGREFMSCMPFRKNRRRASQRRSERSI